ncbi:mycofactocin dehydrogenase MftG [Amycolatopsis pithecellobii]|uniref:mycofactocin dehydrogenase MftG n=1 Tax=Amycolatopsis pithecellobii TaxID=664692 RepID=UPI00140B9690|nr:mycofactocin system GMC family oxidoreductase MftG [Amycolatopsis pithecellobii]
MSREEFDVIIVGSGSCGGALAARLTGDPDRRVLVLEAGAVYESVAALPQRVRDPADVSGGMPGSPHNWELTGEFADGFVAPVARGKVIGGSSSINAAYFIRGTKENFTEWAALGNDEWSYEKVLPFYKRSESEKDFPHDTEHHGTTGPIPVQREPIDRAPEFTRAFTDAAIGLGFPVEDDKNGPGSGGVGPVPTNISHGLRVSSAVGYLIPNLGRTNLTVKGGVQVTRVLFQGTRCIGVEASVEGRTQRFHARQTVLSAGALRTPQLLMLSGIGPARQLKEHGIEVLADVPGVGQNLMDHPKMSSPWTFSGTFPVLPGRNVMTSNLNWTAEGSGQAGDLEILPFVASRASMFRVDTDAVAMRVPAVQVSVMQEDSRGEVTLASADPLGNPRMKWNFFQQESDRVRIREGMKVLDELFHSAPMRAIGAKLLSLDKTDLASNAAMDAWMISHLNYAGHPSCTCKMGPDTDPMAVVDQYGTVRGVENLRICDQSVFPKLTSRGPAATAYLLGERMSAFFA